MKQDFVGQEIAINDFVAFVGTHYRHLTMGRVTGFTAKMVSIAVPHARGHWTTRLQPHKLIKVPTEYALAKALSK